MSQQLKERLTGAAVLVLLGVLVIPEFLSGPPQDNNEQSQPLLLPAAENRTEKSYTIHVEEKKAAEQPPVAQPVYKEPVKSTPKVVEPEPARPAASNGDWAVQTGSFTSLDNARRLAASLETMGYKSFLSRTVVDGRTLHRVRVGPMDSREAAEKVATELRGQGQQAKTVANP